MARTGDSEAIITTLSCGVRIAYRRLRGDVECCGVAISAGSRDEKNDEWGLAHFVEHTIFKGTTRRRSHHVLNRMETVGGELNAYTTKEETYVYTVAPSGNMARSLELLADLIINSRFPAEELDKERVVVIDEINSYLDSPADAAYDDFEDLIFKKSQLGHNILGTPRSVKKLTGEDCHRWIRDNYTAGRIVVFYSGPGPVTRFNELANKYFASVPPGDGAYHREVPELVDPFHVKRNIRSHQAHTVMGLRIPVPSVKERLALNLCNNILGGPGMNSRLNVALRERRGLVYTVESSLAHYGDVLLWNCYFGCDSDHVDLCKKLVTDEIVRITREPLTPRTLAIARRQYNGQVILANASVENSAIMLGRSVLRYGQCMSAKDLSERLENLDADYIFKMASNFLTSEVSSLTLL